MSGTPGEEDQPEAWQRPGLWRDGYGLEVLHAPHTIRTDTEAVAEMNRESSYKLRLSNANQHMCLVAVEVDGIHVGRFLIHPFGQFDLERPIDRPLGFIFCQEEEPSGQRSPSSPTAEKGKPIKQPAVKKLNPKDRTNVVAIFQPEQGAKTIQFDVKAHHIGKSQRLEMRNDCTAQELFQEIEADFGDWVHKPNTVLIHWTTAEYDSPVEDVLTADMRMALHNCKRRDDTLRKMSFITHETITLQTEGGGQLILTADKLLTFGHLVEALEAQVKEKQESPSGGEPLVISQEEGGQCENKSAQPIYYFHSDVGRFICSTSWVQAQTPVYQLLHKDEVMRDSQTLHMAVFTLPPKQRTHVVARVLNGKSYDLELSPATTVRECRFQLAVRGGPWGEDPGWLYGGTPLENGRTLEHYGIRKKDAIDVVLRLSDKGSSRPLEMRDPIAVEGENPIDTGCLVYRNNASKKPQKDAGNKAAARRPRRGATTLRGRSMQQFIEVDAIDVDDRFTSSLVVAIVPKDEGALDAEENTDGKGRACVVM